MTASEDNVLERVHSEPSLTDAERDAIRQIPSTPLQPTTSIIEKEEKEKDDSKLSIDYDDIDISGFDLKFEPTIITGLRERGRKWRMDIRSERQKLKTLAASKQQELKTAIGKPMVVRLKDKLSFTFGITDVALTMFLLGIAPAYFHWTYVIKFPILILIRYFMYHRTKHHYFLLDFCYFANLIFLLYINIFPSDCLLFKVSFSFICGPVAFAVLAWKNSMVFHSIDKITSLFIHVSPLLVTWTLRWWHPDSQFSKCTTDSNMTFAEGSLIPLIPYILWQLLYYIKVQLFDVDKFQQDPTYMTSYKYMVSHKKGIMYKFMHLLGKRYRMYMFGVAQLIYTFLTMIPVKLLYDYFWVHTIFIFVICVVSAWNGACFYIEVFSVRYQESLKECEKQWQQLSTILNNTSTPTMDHLHHHGLKVNELSTMSAPSSPVL